MNTPGTIKLKLSGKNDLLKSLKGQELSLVTEADLSNNPEMISIPEFIHHFPNLKTLNISHTKISSWDENICQLEKLEKLIGRNNHYVDDEVPFHTFCLKNLKVLDMSDSHIRYVDEYIGKLTHLKELHLSGNDLILAPFMLVSLKNLQLVDFQDNSQFINEDLATIQSCEDEDDDDKEDCQEDIAESFECEFFNPIPFQRKKPFRTLYIDLVDSSEVISKACEEDNSPICPHFVKPCKHITNGVQRRECMLNEFESLNIHPDLWINRDRCYTSWAKWYNDFEEFPELLEYSLAGRTIRELLFRTNYSEDRYKDSLGRKIFGKAYGGPDMTCNVWNPVSDIDFELFGITLLDNKPDRIGPQRFEVFPKIKRDMYASEFVILANREGWLDWNFFYDEETKRSKSIDYISQTNQCPHLPEIREKVKRWMEEVWGKEQN